MDDHFDNLDVPEDWLETGSKRKSSHYVDDSPSKKTKLHASENNNNSIAHCSKHCVESDKLLNDSGKSNHLPSSPTLTGTFEDESLNQPENLFDVDTSQSTLELSNAEDLYENTYSGKVVSNTNILEDSKLCVVSEYPKYCSNVFKPIQNEVSSVPTDVFTIDTDKKNNIPDNVKGDVAAPLASVSGDLIADVQLVLAAVPSADANEVFALLESLPSSSDRVNAVVDNLKQSAENIGGSKPVLVKRESSTSILDDPLLKDDLLFRDMRSIAKIFPDKDRNEIYAMLEVHFNKPNRIQLVTNEIISAENNTREEVPVKDVLTQDVERMRVIFPDCDPNYLFETLESMKDQPDRIDILATKMFENKNYPKLSEQMYQKKHEPQIPNPTIEEFLKIFPEPLDTFSKTDKEVSFLYRQHAQIYLNNQFRTLSATFMKSELQKNQHHLYPTYKTLSDVLISTPLEKQRFSNKFNRNKRKGHAFPAEIDEYFYYEKWFIENELDVLEFPKKKEQERQEKLERAKLRGETYECCCCYDDCLFEELTSCPDGHLFCKTCVIKYVESAFGEMKTTFQCLTGFCDQNITLNTLQSIIPANLFSKIVRRIQEEEVLQANLPDLVICPFCPFATVMPNYEDKILKCLNPDCLKESCRLCKEPNHIPLRCEEVEKRPETAMRTYIENMISEAVMRKCHKCGKRFVKDTGCNKMTCVCKATSCYCCKAKDIDYSHFEHNARCANENAEKIHLRDMEEAAIAAKRQYLIDHPEAANIALKSDVKDMIKDYKETRKTRKRVLLALLFLLISWLVMWILMQQNEKSLFSNWV
ncbi:uncharacterized protein LOC131956077 isoform X2 [Physella acuta]|uniref:uncharacterized protein LOC131956077 isoform X2 n=1 Tax=Physella acuta TaxID=109671 RepID=UPI0027DD0EED|nr:uncharacterized protein LOC131956077 isoform X2 [Physella acuta]